MERIPLIEAPKAVDKQVIDEMRKRLIETFKFKGCLYVPEGAKYSMVLLGGQHGNEFNGIKAANGAIDMAKNRNGRRFWNPEGKEIEMPAIEGVNEVAFLCIPVFNMHGVIHDTRWNGNKGRYDDDNRIHHLRNDPSWEDQRIRLLYQAIDLLPGKIFGIDFHDTYKNRIGDPRPDTHVYMRSGVGGDLIKEADESMMIVDSKEVVNDEDYLKTFQGAMEGMGHWACTLELSRTEPNAKYVGAKFFADIMRVIRRRVGEQAA